MTPKDPSSSATTNPETPTIEVRFHFFPTAWQPGVARQVFDTLVGPGKIYPATAWGNEGDDPLPPDPVAMVDLLAERYEASHRSNRITLFTDEPTRVYSFDLFRSEWDDEASLGQLLFWPKTLRFSTPVNVMDQTNALDAVTHVAEITGAPLVEIDYRAGWSSEPITLAAQRDYKRLVQGRVHAKAAAGPWRGLHHIPWRLVLGTDIVATIGADRLARLPADRGIDHGNGLWTLQTTVDPADSITAEGRANEQQIVSTLGSEYFTDTEANRLAETAPAFPAELVPDDDLLVARYGERVKPL